MQCIHSSPSDGERRTEEIKTSLPDIFSVIKGKDTPLNLINSYEFETDKKWQVVPDMSVERYGAGVVVHDGKLYSVGGANSYYHAHKSVECLDLSDSEAKWQKLGAEMTEERDGVGVVVHNGKLFAVGGQDHNCRTHKSAECLDLSDPEAKWQKLDADMSEERCGAGVAVHSGKLYAVGGRNDNGDYLNSAECLDLSSDSKKATWRKLPDTLERRSGAGVAVHNGKLYYVAGVNHVGYYLNSVESLDLTAESNATWQKLYAHMSQERYEVGVAAHSGKLYAVGGGNQISDHVYSVESLDLTEPNAKWQIVSKMSVGRIGAGVIVQNGKLYAVGGMDDSGNYLKSVECLRISYSPRS
jgi:kelch-like protein 1/4/5